MKILTDEAEYAHALSRIDEIFDAGPGTPESDELDLLVLLVEHYESSRYEIPAPDPLSAIRFRMEQQGLKPKDLIPIFRTLENVKSVLKGERSLTLSNIRSLHQEFGIPLESLVRKLPKHKPNPVKSANKAKSKSRPQRTV